MGQHLLVRILCHNFFKRIGKIVNNLLKCLILSLFQTCESESMCSVQFSSVTVMSDCNPMNQSTPGLPVHHQLPESPQIHVHWVSDVIQPFHPLSCPSPPALNLSQHQGLFQWVSSLHKVAKVLEFQFQHQSFHEYSGLITFRIDWPDILAGDSQESSPTSQFKSINTSMLSFLYSPTLTSIHDYWKNHSFDKANLCQQSKVSYFFNMLSRLAITFLPRSKCLLISWLQSPSAVIFEPPEIKSILFPLFPHLFAIKCGTGCHALSFLNVEF